MAVISKVLYGRIQTKSYTTLKRTLQQECKELVEGVGRVKINLKKEEVGAGAMLSTSPRPHHHT